MKLWNSGLLFGERTVCFVEIKNLILFSAVHSANPEEELASEFLASVQAEGVFGHDSEESQPSSQEDWTYIIVVSLPLYPFL